MARRAFRRIRDSVGMGFIIESGDSIADIRCMGGGRWS
jgi:hypothetical protein